MAEEIEIHQRENNPESENNLQENQKKFSRQCLLVLQLLRSGTKLTCKSALINHGIGHLPRRILDLKENGIQIDEKWLYDDSGKRTCKEWSINFKTTKATKKSVAEHWKKKIEEGKSQWVQQFLI